MVDRDRRERSSFAAATSRLYRTIPLMTATTRTHLDQLENQSIFIFREAYHSFKNIVMPWSMGKDSYETHDPVTVTHELKTVALQQALVEYKWDALITGIRRDEDPTRAKERYFSPRNAQFEWDYKDQPPEFWGQFATNPTKGEHVRVQPLLDWTEVDIWRYIEREKVPIPKMYFSRNGKRFRSLGCSPITLPIDSNASTIDQIIAELENTKTSERAGRAQDHHERNAMQKLRAKGFL
jgi:sulfate adenylyltransferase subunit 2